MLLKLTNKKIAFYPNEYSELFEYATLNNTFDEFERKLIKTGISIFECDDERNKFYGDAFELFAELFFNNFQRDPHFGITNYIAVQEIDDYGVDAIGINPNNKNCAIQVKFRSNPNDPILYADIAKTFTSAILQIASVSSDVINYDSTIYLFSNSNNVSIALKKVMGNKIVIVNRQTIKKYTNGNASFWDNANKLVQYSLS